MKQSVIFLISLLSLGSQAPLLGEESMFSEKVEFFDSMEWATEKNKHLMHQYSPSSENLKRLLFFKALYDKNNFFRRPAVYETKIPKIIHQIWLGPTAIPPIFKESQESLRKYHPTWQYKLWTDKDIDDLHLHNKKFYDLSNNYGEKADILRYELLYKFGGVYADVDLICLKPFDVLSQYDLWTGIEPLNCSAAGLNNAIIASIPNHPILNNCIEGIKNSWYESTNIFFRVGPRYFTKCFLAYAKENFDNIIAFPKSFFYPIDCSTGVDPSLLQPESFGVHLWEGSWGHAYRKKRKKKSLPLSSSRKSLLRALKYNKNEPNKKNNELEILLIGNSSS